MKIAIIGAGFGGLSAAAVLARAGHQVTVYEQNDQPGGRAFVYKKDGFTFDLGPSWYLMPDVYEAFFAQFGKKPGDYYQLQQLLPSYRVYFEDEAVDVRPAPAAYMDFEQREPGAGEALGRLLDKTRREYHSVRQQLLETDGLHLSQFLRPAALKLLLNPELQRSYHHRIASYIQNEKSQKILEFMAMFMGGSPHTIPALYSLLSWVDLGLKVWYPMGGFGAVAQAFARLAEEQGAKIVYNAQVEHIKVVRGQAQSVRVNGIQHQVDAVLANADYQHVETALLDAPYRTYDQQYWQQKTISPSAVVGVVGLKKKLPLLHHNLFFDAPWDENFQAVFAEHRLYEQPLFYVAAPSQTDPSVAPKGCENLFILIPVAHKKATIVEYEMLLENALARIAQKTGVPLSERILTRELFDPEYFQKTFNAYLGNSFGLAHTRAQSGPLRPKIQSSKVHNLFYAGHYTNPGTGVPLVILSGQVAARALMRRVKA